MDFPSYNKELEYLNLGYDMVIGCDEVGVGPVAGPVVAAVCLLKTSTVGKYRSKKKWYYRVRDSKTTNEKERQILLKEILENTVAFGLGEVWQKDIDKLNIHNASLEAMRLATLDILKKLQTLNREDGPLNKIMILVDGRFTIPGLDLDQKSVISGDRKILSIAAASIIAKVHRDNIMNKLDLEFPHYGFVRNKGYNTKEHLSAIKKYGIVTIHRKSFLKKYI